LRRESINGNRDFGATFRRVSPIIFQIHFLQWDISRIRSLLVDGDNFQRKSIDYFSPLRQYIGGIILEMKDSIFFASDAETLRNNSVFNPVYDGNNMGLPSNRVVS
jgi:hypothetical protein